MLVAGAHRDAGTPPSEADPRDHPGSLFHRLAVTLLAAGMPHLQVHGFADRPDRPFDVVLSSGPTTASVPVSRMAESLAAHGLTVALPWMFVVPSRTGPRADAGTSGSQARTISGRCSCTPRSRPAPASASRPG